VFFLPRSGREVIVLDKKLIVVKVGTSSLTNKDGSISRSKIEKITTQLSALREEGHRVVLVSSGAIAAGFSRLGFVKRPTHVADKQASAAVGQSLLMEEYTTLFYEKGVACGQILLTQDDFTDRRRYKNAFRTLSVLLSRGAIPIINENDTVAVDEIKIGDNDMLSAQVAAMLHSSLLILLTDVDGLYTANPAKDACATHIDIVEDITPELISSAGSAGSENATGGMATKLKCAQLATSAGVPVFICSSQDDGNILAAVAGTARGTLFTARGNAMKTRQQWMAFYASSCGNIYVDSGAAEALTARNKSLLPRGVVAAEGDFHSGDVVNVYLQGSHEFLGRGIINYAREELIRLAGTGGVQEEAINRDNWVGVCPEKGVTHNA